MNAAFYVIGIIIIGVIIHFTGNTRTALFKIRNTFDWINKRYWNFMFKFNEYINSNISIALLYLLGIVSLSYYMLFLVKMFN